MVGRYNYVMGGDNAYGVFYGDTFDGAQLKYQSDSFAATAGYGKFKAGYIGGAATGYYDNGETYYSASAKTAYGELEGFFGNGSAVGVYYNKIMPDAYEIYNDVKTTADLDNIDVWGAYGSFNLGSKWNLLANYETYRDVITNDNGSKDDADVWVGKLTYGAANFATPKSWDIWVEYLNADQLGFDGTFLGSTNGWRNDNLTSNVKSWGTGIDYTFAKNAQFQVMQSFSSEAKTGDNDPGEETRAQFVFVF